MTDFPAIMSAPMIRAILREEREPGTGKTCTRRLAWTGRKAADGEGFRPSPWQRAKRGDRIWIREHAAFTIDQGTGKPAKTEWFFADGENLYEDNFTVESRSSIHMPRWASRLTLHVTSTKIERLQDITETDALAEGIRETAFYREDHPASICFSMLWDSLHGVGSWNANPFVVAVSFRPVLANIDSLEIAA